MDSPSFWPSLPLGTLAKEMCLGKMLDKQKNRGSLQPYLRNINVRWFGFDLDNLKEMRFEEDEEERFSLIPGDLVICEGGEPGRAAVWKGEHASAKIQKALHRVRFDPELYDPYFAVFFIYYGTQTHRFAQAYTGTTIKHLTGKAFARVEFPIAPYVEQRAIVDKIEALFSELDQGVAQLEAARAQLKRYRQAVLKAAFEGKLTADWRAEQQKAGNLPTADDLLEQIKSERAARYEQQLTEWKQAVKAWEAAGGKDSDQKKPRKPAKLKDTPALTEDELEALPVLPQGWAWTRLGLAIEDPQYGTSKKCRPDTNGTSVLRIPNISFGHVDPTNLKYAQFSAGEIEQYALSAGDILIIRSNGSVSLVGRPALITENDIDHLFAGYLVRLRPNGPSVLPKFIVRCLMSHDLRMQIERLAKSTSGVNNINAGEIRSLVLPVCSLDEQVKIVDELDSRTSVLDRLEQSLDEAIAQANALRQSILEKAFEGRLLDDAELAAVRADPAYEPAKKLLERIRAEREAAEAKTKKPTRRRKAKAKAAGGAV